MLALSTSGMPVGFTQACCRTGIAPAGSPLGFPGAPVSGLSDSPGGCTGLEGVHFRAHASRSPPLR
eukprot:7391649-Prymnesium_polylepis.7